MRTLTANCLIAVYVFALCDAAPAQNVAHVTKEPFARDGTKIQAALPVALHMRNTGGNDRTPHNPLGQPGKGSGLCVWTSINQSALHQNVPQLQGLQEWMTKHAGGGTPSRVKFLIPQFCREQGVEEPDLLQIESPDLQILKTGLNSGRLAFITYGVSPTGRYGGSVIYHMVNLAAAGVGKGPDGNGWWAVQDNNYPGTWEWMSEAQFRRAYSAGSGPWAGFLVAPSPPPVAKE